jgi:hypothetical protein
MNDPIVHSLVFIHRYFNLIVPTTGLIDVLIFVTERVADLEAKVRAAEQQQKVASLANEREAANLRREHQQQMTVVLLLSISQSWVVLPRNSTC